MRLLLTTAIIITTFSLIAQNKSNDMTKNDSIIKSEDEWKKELTPEQYRVLRQCGTEPAFTGKYYKNKEKGVYVCAACGAVLFSSDTKYDSGSGWPSFYDAINKDAIIEEVDTSYGMRRIEIKCARCGSHLGHIFPDGPKPTGLRYCVNSVSLDFQKEGEIKK